jgi:hypothetical protein
MNAFRPDMAVLATQLLEKKDDFLSESEFPTLHALRLQEVRDRFDRALLHAWPLQAFEKRMRR